jgi:hypothetical protein
MNKEQHETSIIRLAEIIARRITSIRNLAAEKGERYPGEEVARQFLMICERALLHSFIYAAYGAARIRVGARGHRAVERTEKACSMTRRKPHVLDKVRTGKFAEGAKGPFSSDIMMRMKLVLGHLAKKSMTLEEVRIELNTYFSDWFGKRTLNHVPSDAFRRTLLVDRMVNFAEQIRAGGPAQPLWN